jgi:hypothetical protein
MLNTTPRFGVDTRQPAMQAFGAAPLGNRVKPRANVLIAGGARKESARQRAIVEARAARNNRHAAARGDVADGACRIRGKAGSGERLGRLGDVDQVVRDSATV